MNVHAPSRTRNESRTEVLIHDDFPDGNPSRVYCITFDLNQALLREHCPDSCAAAYDAICKVLRDHGFQRQQQSVYFGRRGSNAISCVLAVQDIQRRHPWFRRVVKDIRMLRVEEFNDLYPALGDPELPLG
jgi:virulence-associated protein VapD